MCIGSAAHRSLAHKYSVDLCIRLGMHTLADAAFVYFKQTLWHLLTALFLQIPTFTYYAYYTEHVHGANTVLVYSLY